MFNFENLIFMQDIKSNSGVTKEHVKMLLKGSGIELIAFQTGTRPELNFLNEYLSYTNFDVFHGYNTLWRRLNRAKITIDTMFFHYQFSYYWVSPYDKYLPYRVWDYMSDKKIFYQWRPMRMHPADRIIKKLVKLFYEVYNYLYYPILGLYIYYKIFMFLKKYDFWTKYLIIAEDYIVKTKIYKLYFNFYWNFLPINFIKLTPIIRHWKYKIYNVLVKYFIFNLKRKNYWKFKKFMYRFFLIYGTYIIFDFIAPFGNTWGLFIDITNFFFKNLLIDKIYEQSTHFLTNVNCLKTINLQFLQTNEFYAKYNINYKFNMELKKTFPVEIYNNIISNNYNVLKFKSDMNSYDWNNYFLNNEEVSKKMYKHYSKNNYVESYKLYSILTGVSILFLTLIIFNELNNINFLVNENMLINAH